MKIVDIHTHGLGGFDTRTSSPGDILNVAELHGQHGVTDIVPTIYPGTIGVMREHMAAVRTAMDILSSVRSASGVERSATLNSKFARIAGIHLEGPFINPLKSGALDATFFQKPSERTWKSLVEGFEDMVKIVTIAPELEGSLELIKILSDSGIAVSLGHSDATYNEADKAFHAGAKCVTHLMNAMRDFHHREPGLAGFGLLNPDIYVEVVADPYHLHEKTIELVFKTKNPGKIIIVSDSVRNTPPVWKGQSVRDHNGVLQGGAMTISESARRLTELGFDEAKVMGCISTNPLSYLLSAK